MTVYGPDAESEPIPRRVLLVDDQPMVRTIIERSLVAEGFEVIAAGESSEAITVVTKLDRPLDLAMIDLHLDGENGELLADALRVLQPGLPVVFVTGEPPLERIGQMIGPILPKPFGTLNAGRCAREFLDTGRCSDCDPRFTMLVRGRRDRASDVELTDDTAGARDPEGDQL
jgi:CheY-like chemotaxis protein